MTDTASSVVGVILIFVIMFAYFIPTIVANVRNHHNAMAIVVLNLFLGWTFIGWLAALVWACTAVRSRAYRNEF